MPNPLVPSALLLLLAAPAMSDAPAFGRQAYAGRIIFHQHIVIRIPRMPVPPPMVDPAPLPPIAWREKSGPKCIASDTLVAATIPTSDSVDLMLDGGERIRAKLSKKCRALDFYTGFYVEGGRDGQVCVRRDSIRSRSGDKCGIDKFKRLVPAR